MPQHHNIIAIFAHTSFNCTHLFPPWRDVERIPITSLELIQGNQTSRIHPAVLTMTTMTATTIIIIVKNISRVPNQNGVSLLYNVLGIYHSGREPRCIFFNDKIFLFQKWLNSVTPTGALVVNEASPLPSDMVKHLINRFHSTHDCCPYASVCLTRSFSLLSFLWISLSSSLSHSSLPTVQKYVLNVNLL